MLNEITLFNILEELSYNRNYVVRTVSIEKSINIRICEGFTKRLSLKCYVSVKLLYPTIIL